MAETDEQHRARMLELAVRSKRLRVRRVRPANGPEFWDVQRGDRREGGWSVCSLLTFVRRADAVDFHNEARVERAARLAARRARDMAA